MENTNYINHNRRILNAVAAEEQLKWEKERDARALKRAKKDVITPLGKTFKSLADLETLR